MTPKYKLVMRAYPKSYRSDHGDELVGTANELADGWSLRQARSLVVEGLRTRPRVSSNGSPKEAWASAIAFGLGILHLTTFSFGLSLWFEQRGVLLFDNPVSGLVGGISIAHVVLGALPLVAITRSTRWPTAVITAVAQIALAGFGLTSDLGSTGAVIAGSLAYWLALSWWLAMRSSGPRAFSPVFGAASVVAMLAATALVGAFPFTVPVAFALLLLGFALTAVDPRPLIAAITIFGFFFVPNVARLDLLVIAAMAIPLVAFVLLARFTTRRVLAS